MLKRQAEADGAGGHGVRFSPAGAFWVQADPQPGGETEQAGGLRLMRQWRVRLRHRGDIAPGDRLRLDRHTLDIRDVLDPIGDRRWLDIVAQEEVSS